MHYSTDIKKASIWQVPAYLPYIQQPLTDKVIRATEADFGISLPRSYLDILHTQNGGYIGYGLPDLCHRVINGIGDEYPRLKAICWSEFEDDTMAKACEGLIPFDGDGHWFLCFDYRHSKRNPGIVYIDTEGRERVPGMVAKSFDGYLDKLERDFDRDDIGIRKVGDTLGMLRRIAEALSMSLDEEPDTWAHGYPVYRAGRIVDGKKDWLWCSPNLVSKGFVRPNDSRYEELKDGMKGESLRYFEYPDIDLVITSTDGISNTLPEVLDRLGFDAFRLIGK
jgi:hypothetical protein